MPELAFAPTRPLLINVGQVTRITGISKTSIYKYIKKGTFPAPVFPTPGSAKWRITDIVAWVDGLKPKDISDFVKEQDDANQPAPTTPTAIAHTQDGAGI